MADDWRSRLDELERRVGIGELEGLIVVNQPYAAYQHVHQELNHPRGGGPNFVSEPLVGNAREFTANLADGVLDGTLNERMARNMEKMADEVFERAPVDLTPLRSSGHPIVRDNGAVVYDRAPLAPRITARERRRRST